MLKAGLSTQADTVYSDTHGQSETDFAFTHLMGIQLMPRIRNWKDLKFYRPDKATRFKHIDRLFKDTINWAVIRDHWQELMQVAISIQAGRISSPILLRKLSNEGRHNRLFAAARELGRVLRTVCLGRPFQVEMVVAEALDAAGHGRRRETFERQRLAGRRRLASAPGSGAFRAH